MLLQNKLTFAKKGKILKKDIDLVRIPKFIDEVLTLKDEGKYKLKFSLKFETGSHRNAVITIITHYIKKNFII